MPPDPPIVIRPWEPRDRDAVDSFRELQQAKSGQTVTLDEL
ncbi:MAG TPA: hypothetical protein VFT50_10935 [Baekduia sp.]|nr:hypothetical protein [Baekduia sp.]